jgi:hypothetical protein
MEYSASFTAGALLREEAEQVIEEVQRGTDLEDVDPEVLDVNTHRGRKRKAMEVIKRLRSVDRSVWDDLLKVSHAEQHVVLYYCCLKAYRLLFDFHMDTVLPKWKSFDRELRPHDARRFLEQRADDHPEIDGWGDSTWEKVRQVMLKMLREAGLLEDSMLTRPQVPSDVWERFVRVGDIWFLEAAFLKERDRTSVINSVQS